MKIKKRTIILGAAGVGLGSTLFGNSVNSGMTAYADTYADELAQYEVKKKEYDDAMARYRRETEQREREWKQKVDNFRAAQRDYEAKLKEYTTNLVKYNERMDAYNKEYAEYEAELAKYHAELNEYAAKLSDYQRSQLTGNASRDAYEKALAEYKAKLDNYKRELENYNRDNQANTIKKTEEIRRQNEYKEALRKYQADMDQYRKDMGQYRKDLDQYNKEKDAAEKENARIKNENKNNQDSYDKLERQYQRDLAEYEREKARIANEPAIASGNGWKLVGSYGSQGENYYSNITMVADDSLGVDVVDGTIGWGTSTSIVDIHGVQPVPGHPQGPGPMSKWGQQYHSYTFKNLTPGSGWTYRNVGKTKSGKTINLKITIENNMENVKFVNGYDSQIMTGPAGLSLTGVTDTYRKPIQTNIENSMYIKMKREFVDESGKPIKLAVAELVSDVDWGQGLYMTYGSNEKRIVAPGSDLFEYQFDGHTLLKSPSGSNIPNDYSRNPLGTYLHVGVSTESYLAYYSDQGNFHTIDEGIKNKVRNPQSGINGSYLDYDAGGYRFDYFGSPGLIRTLTKPTPPTKPTPTPEKPFDKTKPTQPTEPKEPEKPPVENIPGLTPPTPPIEPLKEDKDLPKDRPTPPVKPQEPEKPWIEQPTKPVPPKDESGERPKPGTPPVEPKKPIAKNVTDWQDVNGNTLKPREEGQLPDNEGDDIPGYKLVRIENKPNGDVLNVYRLVKTRWVDEKGVPLKTPVDGTYPDNEGDDIPGYELVRIENKDDGDTVNVYRKKPNGPTIPNQKRHTRWVDDKGTPLKPQKDGEFPDTEGDDIPGYKLIRIERDKDGNVTNVYKKTKTRWIDEGGNPLKPDTDGDHPDREGDDVPGYRLVKIAKDKDGNTINIYRKIPKEPTDPEKPLNRPKKTRWIDEQGTPLKPESEGEHPDNEGDDVPGYKLVKIEKDKDGNVTNIYKKTDKPKKTRWVDEGGNPLKPETEGEFPDREGDDIPGYKLVKIERDNDGNVTNIYKKMEDPKAKKTRWVDEVGNPLKSDAEGTFPDNEGDDIPGYKLIKIETDKDGNIINIYKKVNAPTVKKTRWVDEHDTPLKPETEGTFPDKEGDDIPGYRLVKITNEPNGDTVNHYVKIRTFFKDPNGNDIIPPEDGDLEKRELPGWRYVRTEKDKDGNTVHIYEKVRRTFFRDTHGKDIIPSEEGELEKRDLAGWTFVRTERDADGNVIHIYTKVKTFFRDENGKDIIPSEDGEKEKRDISGWTYVRTEKDKDGNTIHIYKPTPKELPQTGDASLALYGASALVGSIGTLKRRKRK